MKELLNFPWFGTNTLVNWELEQGFISASFYAFNGKIYKVRARLKLDDTFEKTVANLYQDIANDLYEPLETVNSYYKPDGSYYEKFPEGTGDWNDKNFPNYLNTFDFGELATAKYWDLIPESRHDSAIVKHMADEAIKLLSQPLNKAYIQKCFGKTASRIISAIGTISPYNNPGEKERPVPEITPEEEEKFATAIIDLAQQAYSNGHLLYFYCDYHPQGMLAEALEIAGLTRANSSFPAKTEWWVTFEDKSPKVLIANDLVPA